MPAAIFVTFPDEGSVVGGRSFVVDIDGDGQKDLLALSKCAENSCAKLDYAPGKSFGSFGGPLNLVVALPYLDPSGKDLAVVLPLAVGDLNFDGGLEFVGSSWLLVRKSAWSGTVLTLADFHQLRTPDGVRWCDAIIAVLERIVSSTEKAH